MGHADDLTRGTSSSTGKTQDQQAPTKMAETDKETAAAFKSDLTQLRSICTCSICDQLLYEPWTLSCGHTYCYSCLCNWFIPNARKKSCPECRTKIKQMPAQSFLIKSMVDVLMQRRELMPADESYEQHVQRRNDEVTERERDKEAPSGLFKGVFPTRPGELIRDEADRVMRCPHCAFEHNGGSECLNCGAIIEDEDDAFDFSDFSDDMGGEDLDSISIADGDSVDMELAELHSHHPLISNFPFDRRQHFDEYAQEGYTDEDDDGSSLAGYAARDDEDRDQDEDEDDGDDESGSLAEFVAPDDEDPTPEPHGDQQTRSRSIQPETITISDDDSEDEAPINHRNRVRQRRAREIVISSPSVASSPATNNTTTNTNDSDDDSDEGPINRHNRVHRRRAHQILSLGSSVPSIDLTTDSEGGDINSEAEMLRHAGWSPLDQGNDSDVQELLHLPGTYEQEDESLSEDENSDTETIVSNRDSRDEGNSRLHDGYSETSTYNGPPYNPHEYDHDPYVTYEENDYDQESDAGPVVYDRDGDTEMSVSPRGRGASINTDADGSVSDYPESCCTHNADGSNPYLPEYNQSPYRNQGQNLGAAQEVHDFEDDSESPVRPPVRRPRRYHHNSQGQQYNPRISMMFAEHQQTMRATRSGLDELELGGMRRVEPGPRTRRMTSYRNEPSRRLDPLRSSRSPSTARVIASSNRRGREARREPTRLYFDSDA